MHSCTYLNCQIVIFLFLYVLQCRKYRLKMSPDKVKVMKEKLKASELFKGQKSLYPER